MIGLTQYAVDGIISQPQTIKHQSNASVRLIKDFFNFEHQQYALETLADLINWP